MCAVCYNIIDGDSWIIAFLESEEFLSVTCMWVCICEGAVCGVGRFTHACSGVQRLQEDIRCEPSSALTLQVIPVR